MSGDELAVEVEPTLEVVEEPKVEVVAPVEPRMVPLPALQDERRRRQSAEAEVQQYQQFIAAKSARPLAQPELGEVTSIEEGFKKIQDLMALRDIETRSRVSKATARLLFSDYDDVVGKSGILTEIASQPLLAEYIASQDLPAVAAYQLALGRRAAAAPTTETTVEPGKTPVTTTKVVTKPPVTLANAPMGTDAPGELTKVKAAELTDEQWAKLPAATRRRLLGGV